MTAADSFQALGVTGPEESVYRLLLRHPGSTATEISQSLAIRPHSVRTAIASLEGAGLVSRSPDTQPLFFPVAPDVGVEALILRRQADLEQARALADRMMADFHQGRRTQPPDPVEIVSGAEAVHTRFEQLQRSARHLVQVLDAPPYAGPGGTPNRVEFEALTRGVVYRGIYDQAALEAAPGTINAIARYVAAGEQARFLGKLPFKLATFDREFGYVPLTVSQPDIARFMVVRPCSLLDALLYIFDTLWERATPITFGPGSPPGEPDSGDDPPDSRLLNLLATGMTDQAIAHHLGLSYRTTRRRIAALMTELGAESRFQAGLQASRRGWLLPAPPSAQRPAARAVQLRRQLVTMKARISAS
jgi:DNA-binding CsgD family transcriptional regulator